LKTLVVFVHGWGAGAEDWWGTTQQALIASDSDQQKEFHFHRYTGGQAPAPKILRPMLELLGKIRSDQRLGDLGQHLWSNIHSRFHEHDFESIAIFGHSFGGLVVADAITHGSLRAKKYDKEKATLDSIERIALCASPMGGAELATVYDGLTRHFAQNKQLKDLRPDSKKRKEVVEGIVTWLVQNPNVLTLFRATGDPIVTSSSVKDVFEQAKVLYGYLTLDGNHSECVRNIGPTGELKDNFHKITNWIHAPPVAPTIVRPLDLRESCDALLDMLRQERPGHVFFRWSKLAANSAGKVTANYVLRIFLQQLIYAAARISDRSLKSANLWVAHFNGAELNLRSEEREGYFSTDQLLAVGTNSADIRPNLVHEERGFQKSNSAGALAYLDDQPVIVSVASTEYPSKSDKRTGVTHVLGIPLLGKAYWQQANVQPEDGAPLAITVDLHFDKPPGQGEETALRDTAAKVTALFLDYAKAWQPGSIHLALR
jgi:hypothetical protein